MSCEKHLKKATAAYSRYRKKRIMTGLCTECGAPWSGPCQTCDKCRRKRMGRGLPSTCDIVHKRVAEVEVVGDKESLFASKQSLKKNLGDDCGANPKVMVEFSRAAALKLLEIN